VKCRSLVRQLMEGLVRVSHWLAENEVVLFDKVEEWFTFKANGSNKCK